MMLNNNCPLLTELTDALRCLPGIGPKSAQRMAFHLLQHKRQQGKKLAQTLEKAMTEIQHCLRCNNFCETSLCAFCNDKRRNQSLLCVVEHPGDILSIEQSQSYDGLYFVLMGCLSPLDGIGPNEIGVDKLMTLLETSATKEVIFALNSSIEGEATLYYLSQRLTPHNLRLSQLAHGIPAGSNLEFLDGDTLKHAICQRNPVEV